MLHLVVLFAGALPTLAQSVGITAAWDIRETIRGVSTNAERIRPVLEQLRPDEWAAAGASTTYADQWKSVQAQLNYLKQTTGDLAADPERMTQTLDVFLRLQSIEGLALSLADGARRYQNPALADLLSGIVSETESSRARLREYLVELVANKEAELKIMDNEAQRCRDSLLRTRPPSRGAAAPTPQNKAAVPANNTKNP